jgi:hypothetical protein
MQLSQQQILRKELGNSAQTGQALLCLKRENLMA